MGMFTVHLATKNETPYCGAFSELVTNASILVDCKECLQARLKDVDDELEKLDDEGEPHE